MSESEPNKQALAHRVFSIGHILQRTLLVVDLLVFRHISFVGEIIKVASIGLRVKLWNKWSALRAKSSPIDLGEVLVLIDIFDGGKAATLGVDASANVSILLPEKG